MRKLASFILLFALTFAPLTAAAQTQAPPPTPPTPASIVGIVTDAAHQPLAGVTVTLSGTVARRTQTDDRGAYAIEGLPPGTYELTWSKGGYEKATDSNLYLLAGMTLTVGISLRTASFSSLRTIAEVRARGGTFNTSTASVSVVSAQTFQEQGATQVTYVLDQVPGVQISFPGSSANGAAPGAITFPNIRNGLSYETASLIDGHPLSVGLYGDYVTTFLTPALFGSTEIIKGPGAMSPQVNNAINGTVNFRTKDPTADPDPFYNLGFTNFGGVVYSAGVSDTVLNGRLGFVVGIAGNNELSALQNVPVYFDPGTGSGDIDGVNDYGYGCGGYFGSGHPAPLIGTNNLEFYSRVYNHCTGLGTATVSADYNSLAELLKLRFKIGDRSYLTASYLGGQALSNQSGNTGNVIPSYFQPGVPPSRYTGSLKPGSIVDVLSAAYDAQPQFETNNEPIFQLEFSTAFKNDTLLARFYHATIDRIQSAGNADPFAPYPQYSNIYGTLPSVFSNRVFNGEPVLIDQYNYFNDPELDKLTGYSAQYTHPFNENNELTLSADYTSSTSVDYYNDWSYDANQCQLGTIAGSYCLNTSTSLPQGSGQNFTTVLLRDREQFTPKFAGTFSLYQNVYQSNYPKNCASPELTLNTPSGLNTVQQVCLPSGYLETWTAPGSAAQTFVSNVPVTFGQTMVHHMDPRVGFEWRPESSLAVRLAAGSSIAPPFLYVLGQANGNVTVPSHAGPSNPAVETINAGNLQPETAFGYDLGSDYAMHDGATFLSGDVYLTDLFGQFLDERYDAGNCPPTYCPGETIPMVASKYVNLSNARYEGIELGIKRLPAVGWGYQLTGSTQRGYAYDLPPTFYCSFKITPKHLCVPTNYNVNLNILSGVNYQGEYINNRGSTTSGVDNQSVPYLQGNVQVSYRFRNGAFAQIGETLLGKNNSFNEPPFGIAYASAMYPVSHDLAIQVSGFNIFNAYPGLFPVYGGGVTVPLAVHNIYNQPMSAGTIGNVLGPARYLFQITKFVGPPPPQTAAGQPTGVRPSRP